MVNIFPTSSSRCVHQTSGVLAQLAGDALHVSRCLQIEHYSIQYDRKINGTCHLDFPVINSHSNATKFLRIIDRQLLPMSPQIKCSKRPQHTYLKAINGTFISLQTKAMYQKLLLTKIQ